MTRRFWDKQTLLLDKSIPSRANLERRVRSRTHAAK
jgi:hypothetical protein